MKSVSLPRMSLALGLLLLLAACSSRRTLPALMVERLNWMDEVAMAKQVRSLPITDPVREAELLQKMTQQGVAAGLPAENVRSFFTGQMQAAKVAQEDWLQKHPRAGTSFLEVPDLTLTVRPALDEIGRQMIALLAQSRSPVEAAAILKEARARMVRAGYSDEVIQPALAGLQAGMQKPEHPMKP